MNALVPVGNAAIESTIELLRQMSGLPADEELVADIAIDDDRLDLAPGGSEIIEDVEVVDEPDEPDDLLLLGILGEREIVDAVEVDEPELTRRVAPPAGRIAPPRFNPRKVVPPPLREPAPARTRPPRAARPARPPRERPAFTVTGPRVGVGVALVLWLVALPSLRSADPSNYGLLFAGSPLFPLAALVSVGAFCHAVRHGRFADAVASLLAWIVIVRVTVSVITPLPIYSWTYKHLGVVDYLQQHGHVASGADIYMAWPGALAAIAWFSSATGISALALAQWFAVAVHLLIALGVYALARAAHLSPTAAVTAAFLAEILNWVGQDYLSPQAVAFVLALLVLTLLLRARTSAVAGWLSVPVYAAIVVSHQLTPYWLLLIAVALGIGRAVRPRWLAGVYAVLALGYLALHWTVAASYGLISSFDPLANAESNISATGSPGHDFTALMVRVPAVLLWGATAVIAGRQYLAYRRRRGTVASPRHPRWIAVVMAFASFSLLAGQSYGGEAIFRVFLYSLPGCVIVVAPALVNGLLTAPGRAGTPRRLAVRWAAAGAVAVAALTSLQGYYGGWFTNVVRRDSLDQMTLLLRTLPSDSYILSMTSGTAERPIGEYVAFERQHRFYDAPVQLAPQIHPETDSAARIAAQLERLSGNTPGPVYLMITAQMRQYSSYYGVFRPGVLTALPRLLRTDGHWWTIADTPTLQVFRLVGSGE